MSNGPVIDPFHSSLRYRHTDPQLACVSAGVRLSRQQQAQEPALTEQAMATGPYAGGQIPPWCSTFIASRGRLEWCSADSGQATVVRSRYYARDFGRLSSRKIICRSEPIIVQYAAARRPTSPTICCGPTWSPRRPLRRYRSRLPRACTASDDPIAQADLATSRDSRVNSSERLICVLGCGNAQADDVASDLDYFDDDFITQMDRFVLLCSTNMFGLRHFAE